MPAFGALNSTGRPPSASSTTFEPSGCACSATASCSAAPWDIAAQLGWPDTFMAEYLALTQLQADAFVCMDPALARAVSGIVTVASIDDLMQSNQPR